jgi:hypothetical protein
MSFDKFAHGRFARQDYDKQVVASGGAASADYGAAGPPAWSMAAWDAFRAQYGRWPFTVEELPPTFAGAPDWVFERMNIRKPPITVMPS